MNAALLTFLLARNYLKKHPTKSKIKCIYQQNYFNLGKQRKGGWSICAAYQK